MKQPERGIFLSYGSPDKPFVRKLAADLKALEIPVWFDEWEIKVGDSISRAINDAISSNVYFGAVMSDDSIKRPWVQKELQVAMHFQVEGRIKILPIVLTNSADVPPFVKELRYADFSGPYRLGLRDLVLAIDPARASRIPIMEADVSAAEKIRWFTQGFTLDYLKASSNHPRVQYPKAESARKDLLETITAEIAAEYKHAEKTLECTRIELGHHAFDGFISGRHLFGYLRDYLEVEAIEPFFFARADADFRKLFLEGNPSFEAALFSSAKSRCKSVTTMNATYGLVLNDQQKVSLLDKMVVNFERFCLFDVP